MPHAQIILKFLHVTHVAIKDSKKAVLQNRLARKSFKGRMSLQALAFRIFGRPPVMKQGLEASDNPGPQHVQGTFSSDTLRKREDPKVVLHPGLARQQSTEGACHQGVVVLESCSITVERQKDAFLLPTFA